MEVRIGTFLQPNNRVEGFAEGRRIERRVLSKRLKEARRTSVSEVLWRYKEDRKSLTEAVAISAAVGGFPLGPFRAMMLKRCRQYFAMISTRPSICTVCCWMNERR